MTRHVSIIVTGGSLAGALLLAAALALPVTRALANSPGLTELSSQHDPRVSAVRRAGPGGSRGMVGNPNAGAPRVFSGPRGPVGVVGPGFRGPAAGFRPSWRGGRAAFIRGPHRIHRRGLILPLVGLGVLGGLYVGQRYYTPYAYVDGPSGPECAGPTDDGMCELRMTEVPLETGGAELQCVAYCPQ